MLFSKSFFRISASVRLVGFLLLMCLVPSWGQSVSSLRLEQPPGTRLVDIFYDLSGEGNFSVQIEVSPDSGTTWRSDSLSLSGEVGVSVAAGSGKHIEWKAGADWEKQLYLKARVRVSAEPVENSVAMVRISAGIFIMGSPPDEGGRGGLLVEETQHEVTLTRSFYMSQTEVTWDQWSEVRDWALQNGYWFNPGRSGSIQDPGSGLSKPVTGDERGSHPVVEVNWYDTVKWLNAKSEIEGLTPCYRVAGSVYRIGESEPQCDFNVNGYRLPTEAEWEYACRAGTTTAFYTGDILEFGWTNKVDQNLDLAGWYQLNSNYMTHLVRGKQPNAWGLFDMHGNVSEWSWDLTVTRYAFSADPVTDPRGPATGTHRVVRGGDFARPAESCRSAHHGPSLPYTLSAGFGFRMARTAD